MGSISSKINVPVYDHKIVLREYTLPNVLSPSSSKGEQEMARELKNLKIPFMSQFHHPNLRYLRYDFLINYKGLPCLIEYDGEQHFSSQSCLYFKASFPALQERDRLKAQVAQYLKIKLIRIDYSQLGKIRDHLDKALKGKNLLYLSSKTKYSYLTKPQLNTQKEYLHNLSPQDLNTEGSLCRLI